VLVWRRNDLRLAVNPTLAAAAALGRPLLVADLFDEVSPGFRALDGARGSGCTARRRVSPTDRVRSAGGSTCSRGGG